jgi:N utilization substance protein B
MGIRTHSVSRRRRAREVVLQLLYEDDLNPQHPLWASDRFLQRRLNREPDLLDVGRQLLAGVRRHRPEVDRRLAEAAQNWSLHRMAVIDRNVLRLAAYEMRWTEVPARVAINEALELAKRYGSEQSAAFVNGILDRLLREIGTAEPTGPA